MKRVKPIAIWAVLAACSIAGAQTNQPITVDIDGQAVNFVNAQPQMIGGRVLVPLRGVFEQMGANVHWDPATRTVDATRQSSIVELRIGDRNATVNGQPVTMDVPAQLINDSTMVPLRFVGEALGADVNWNDQAYTVMITTSGAAENSNNYHPQPTQAEIDAERRREADAERARERDQNYQYRRTQEHMRIALPVNTIIPLVLNDQLSSRDSQSGDAFTATVDTRGQSNYGGIPNGSVVEGHVVYAARRHGGDPGTIQLAFDRLRLPDGTAVQIEGNTASMTGRLTRRDNNGIYQGRNQDKPLVYIGYGAGAGAVLGILTRGNVLSDAVIGAGLGFLVNVLEGSNRTNPHDVTLRQGSQIAVRLTEPLDI